MRILRAIGRVLVLPFLIAGEVERRKLENIEWVRGELIKAYDAKDEARAARLTLVLNELTGGGC